LASFVLLVGCGGNSTPAPGGTGGGNGGSAAGGATGAGGAAGKGGSGAGGSATGGTTGGAGGAAGGNAGGASGSTGAGGAVDAGMDVAMEAPPPGPTGCPGLVPNTGSACDVSGQLCTYGTAPRAECRDQATCNGGTWSVVHANTANCTAAPTGDCPATSPAKGAMVTCSATDENLYCEYPADNSGAGVECKCTNGSLLCGYPALPPGMGCTPQLPNAGTACTPDPVNGTSCYYPRGPGNCGGAIYSKQVLATCYGLDGSPPVWSWSQTNCGGIIQ
jgi:hypothetical protein